MAKITPADIVIRAQDKTKPGIESAKKGVGGLTSAVKSYGAEMAAVYLVVRQVATAMIQLSKEAAYLKQINMAFESMAEAAGESSTEMLEAMRELSGGTISTMEMIQSANRAMVLGLPIDKLDDMMRIARASATATGESVKKMFDDIVVGIGRQSRMILDNLGIIVKTEEANQDYAKAMGIVGRELTDVEKRQAFMNATLEAGEEIIKKVGKAGQEITSAERWQRMTAAIADLRVEMGMGLLPVFELVTEQVTKWARAITEVLQKTEEWRELIRNMNIQELEEQIRLNDLRLDQMTFEMSVLDAVMASTGRLSKAHRDAKKELEPLNEEWSKLTKSNYLAWQQIEKLREGIVEILDPIDDATDAVIAFDESIVLSGQALDDYIEMLDSARESKEYLREETGELITEEEKLARAYAASADALRELAEARADYTLSIKDTDEAQKELNERQEYAVGIMERLALSFEEGETIMKEMAKEGAAIILEALGKILLAQAALHWFRPFVAATMAVAGMAAIAGAKYIQSLQQGGEVKKQLGGYGGGDIIPAMLEPGEMVIRKEVVRENRPALEAMNAGEQGMMVVNVYLGTRKIHSEITKAIRNKQILVDSRAIVT